MSSLALPDPVELLLDRQDAVARLDQLADRGLSPDEVEYQLGWGGGSKSVGRSSSPTTGRSPQRSSSGHPFSGPDGGLRCADEALLRITDWMGGTTAGSTCW
jgi:hypothetical protein